MFTVIFTKASPRLIQLISYHPKQKLLPNVLPFHCAETDEASQEGDDFVAGETSTLDNLIQRLLALHDLKQTTNVVVVGEYGSLRLLRLSPERKKDG